MIWLTNVTGWRRHPTNSGKKGPDVADIVQPRPIAHLGITVPNLDEAVDWYSRVLGFRLIAPVGEVVIADGGHMAELCADIFGADLKAFRSAHLSTAGGVALELLEFVDPAVEPPVDNFEYWRGGFSHLCVVDPDIEGLVEKIVANGGRRRTKVWTMFEGDPYKLAYCEDPFGNILEIYTHSNEQTVANRDG
jgi:catechol 2,3-dioxygenase-like lactoylglutathione lyase family enzyme